MVYINELRNNISPYGRINTEHMLVDVLYNRHIFDDILQKHLWMRIHTYSEPKLESVASVKMIEYKIMRGSINE